MNNRWTIPGKYIESLFTNQSFFKDVSQLKKANSSKFPKYDQWFEGGILHMNFALAGFSPKDISVKVCGNFLIIESMGMIEHVSTQDIDEDIKNKIASTEMQKGIISRGIARRRFESKFLISSDLNLTETTATMLNGLLTITIPSFDNDPTIEITIEG